MVSDLSPPLGRASLSDSAHDPEPGSSGIQYAWRGCHAYAHGAGYDILQISQQSYGGQTMKKLCPYGSLFRCVGKAYTSSPHHSCLLFIYRTMPLDFFFFFSFVLSGNFLIGSGASHLCFIRHLINFFLPNILEQSVSKK